MRCTSSLALACLLAATLPASAQQKPATPAPAATASTAPAPIQPNTLMDGTPIKLRLAETISSENAKVGQSVPFEVTEDVIVQGVTLIPKGSSALATVTTAEPKKRMGRGGKLDVNVDSTRLIDGEKVQLRASRENKGGGHVGVMTTAMVGTAIVFFPAAPLFLLMHGKDIIIPKGTEITAFTEGDMHLEMARFVTASAPATLPGATPSTTTTTTLTPATATMSGLTVESTPSGADIEIDDVFVGSTPSTVNVTPGQHHIVVKKKGYADWSRTMTISGPSIHVAAELEAVKP